MNAKPLLPLLLSLLLGVPAVARDPTEVPAFAAQDEWVLQRVLRLRSDLRNTETRLEDLAEAIAEPDGLLKAAALFDKPELLDLRNRCLHVRQERDSLRAAQDGDPERLRELEAELASVDVSLRLALDSAKERLCLHANAIRSRLDAWTRKTSPPPSRSTPVGGEVKVIALPGGAAMEFVYCPPGPFYMGSNSVDNPDEISGGASLSHGFWIAKTEVTQTQWQSVMGDNPSAIPGDELPVGNVSWNDCREFCKKAGFGLRLPTEAQWEYACRHGPRHSCIDLVLPDQKMWHAGNSGGEPHPVAQKEPNRRGLFDMLGNQLEWCSDWYAPYPKVSTSNPSGPATGTLRVARGGSWETPVQDCRDARRFPFPPDTRIPSIGFRPVIPAEEEFMFP